MVILFKVILLGCDARKVVIRILVNISPPRTEITLGVLIIKAFLVQRTLPNFFQQTILEISELLRDPFFNVVLVQLEVVCWEFLELGILWAEYPLLGGIVIRGTIDK